MTSRRETGGTADSRVRPWRRGEVLLLSALIVLQLTTRFIHLPGVNEKLMFDEKAYIQQSRFWSGELIPEGDPYISKPPLYPLFLAGLRPLFGDDFAKVKAVQVILDSLGGLIFYLLARRLFGRGAAVISLVSLIIFVPFISCPLVLLSETLFLPLLLGFMLLLALSDHSPRGRTLIFLAGAVGGLAAMARDLLFPALLLFAAFLAIRSIVSKSANRARPLLFLAGLMVVVGPWTVRNYVVHHAFVPISTVGWSNFWFFSTRGDSNLSGREFQSEKWGANEEVGARQSRAVHEGLAGILAKPADTLKRAAHRSVKFVTVLPNGPGFFQRRLFSRKGIIPESWLPWYLRVKAVQYWIVVFAGVTGLILAERSLVKWWALLFVPYLFLVHSLTLPKDRFTWPWIIVFILFGSAAGSLLVKRIRRFKTR